MKAMQKLFIVKATSGGRSGYNRALLFASITGGKSIIIQ